MKNDRLDRVLQRIEEEEREQSRRAWLPLYALGFVVVAGLCVMGYLTYRSDRASGDVVLPAALGQKPSAARQDLGLHVRSLHELALDADKKLRTPGPKLQRKAERFRTRIAQAREVGRALEPRVSREESRVLMAATSALKRIEQFVNGSTNPATFKHEEIEIALRQLERAKKLALGDEEGASAMEGVPVLGMAAQVKSVTSNLAEIKKAQETLKKVQEESFRDLDPAQAPRAK